MRTERENEWKSYRSRRENVRDRTSLDAAGKSTGVRAEGGTKRASVAGGAVTAARAAASTDAVAARAALQQLVRRARAPSPRAVGNRLSGEKPTAERLGRNRGRVSVPTGNG